MYRDLQTGAYDPNRDPPFLHSHPQPVVAQTSNPESHDSGYASSSQSEIGNGQEGEEEEEKEVGMEYEEMVSPMDKPQLKPRPKYASLTTAAQREEYQDQVLDVVLQSMGFIYSMASDQDGSCSPLSSPVSPASLPKTLSDLEDEIDEEDIRFAYYRVDYHIHLHEQSRRSMLWICRDTDDLRQLRGWQTELRQLDCATQASDNGSGQEDDLFAVHQLAVWRRAWSERERRVYDVRKTWAKIMEKRRQQRLQMLQERQNLSARFRFYARHDGHRVFLREFNL